MTTITVELTDQQCRELDAYIHWQKPRQLTREAALRELALRALTRAKTNNL